MTNERAAEVAKRLGEITAELRGFEGELRATPISDDYLRNWGNIRSELVLEHAADAAMRAQSMIEVAFDVVAPAAPAEEVADAG